MKGKFILIFLFVFIFQSCDPSYDAKIINNSDMPIKVIFEYDEGIMRKDLDRNISFIPEVVYNNENTRNLFEIDSINFIVTSIVQSKDTLDLEMGIGTRPKFRDLKLIKFFGPDSLIFDSKEKMINAFTQKGKYQYELIIK